MALTLRKLHPSYDVENVGVGVAKPVEDRCCAPAIDHVCAVRRLLAPP